MCEKQHHVRVDVAEKTMYVCIWTDRLGMDGFIFRCARTKGDATVNLNAREARYWCNNKNIINGKQNDNNKSLSPLTKCTDGNMNEQQNK